MSKILITGACGFIGQNLVRKLRSLNHTIVCVDNLRTGNRENVSQEIYKIDVTDPNFVKVFSDYNFDIIYHLASACSVIQFNKNPLKELIDSSTGFHNILQIARECDFARVVFPSSGNVYGHLPVPQCESMNVYPLNYYALSKIIWEQMASISNLNTVGLRIFAGYGPGEEHKKDISSVVTLFLRDMFKGNRPIIWGDGNQTRDFIHIDDIVDALVKVGRVDGSPPIINLGTGYSTSYNELVSLLNKYLDTNIEPIYISKPKAYVEKTQADTILLKHVLNIKPLPFKEGLKKYVK